MIHNDACACNTTPEKDETTYVEFVGNITKLSTFVVEKTKTLGAVLFGCDFKVQTDEPKGSPADLNNIIKKQIAVLTDINLMLDEILVRLVGYTPIPPEK